MESYEATRAVFSKVQNIDPENASKIMGYILLTYTEKDMIRFAHGPETIIVSILNRAKTELGLSSNTLSAPHLVSPISNPISISRPNPLSLTSPRLHTNNGFNPSSPLSSPLSSIWSPHHSASPNANANSCVGPTQVGFRENFVDDIHLHEQNLNFLNNNPLAKNGDFFDPGMDLALSPSCRSDSMLYGGVENHPHPHPHLLHRRSSSFNEGYFGTDDSTSGFGYKPCLYYTKGFCKNGGACKFVHGGGFLDTVVDNSAPGIVGVGSPSSKYDAFVDDELLRSKIVNQQRLAAHLMANGLNLPDNNKLNFLHGDAQRSALMMNEEFNQLNRARIRHEFLRGDSNPGSRQIYLTFPADSTFREEDVSEYFSRFGPVQDVRIPYQQKRMFGFVTFVYSETVNIILAKGNPHFVCDSRVLVKPYKEKGKLPDKKQQQQMERGDFSCSSPPGLDCREPFEFPLGGRMFHSPEELLLKRKLEEQALDLQSRRLMNLQLLDMKNHHHQYNMPIGSPILSPNLSLASSNQNAPPPSNGIGQDDSEENNGNLTEASNQQLAEGVDGGQCDSNDNVQNKEDDDENDECELPERLSSGHGALGM